MWDIMKEPLFHGNDMPLRYPEAGGHKQFFFSYTAGVDIFLKIMYPAPSFLNILFPQVFFAKLGKINEFLGKSINKVKILNLPFYVQIFIFSQIFIDHFTLTLFFVLNVDQDLVIFICWNGNISRNVEAICFYKQLGFKLQNPFHKQKTSRSFLVFRQILTK